MPDPYVLGTAEDLFRLHAATLRECDARMTAGEDPAFALSWRLTRRGSAEVAICAPDRPGLVSKCAGALAAHGMDVLSARIAGSNDGRALDAFRIEWDVGRDEEAWDRLRETLGRILAGAVRPESLMGRAPRWRRPARRRPTVVAIDNEASSTRSVIDVETDDRPGLLFTITNTLFELGLDVHLAKINTVVERAMDVLYVTDGDGRKVTDPTAVATIERTLREALAPDGGGDARQEAGAAG